MIRLNLMRLITCLCLATLVAGCGTLNRLTSAGDTYREHQTIDDLTIELERPELPQVNMQQQMVITLTDAQGAPVDGAVVYVRLVMTAHPMGMNQPLAKATGSGHYAVEALYTMEGDWDVTVVADVAGRVTEARFIVPVIQ